MNWIKFSDQKPMACNPGYIICDENNKVGYMYWNDSEQKFQFPNVEELYEGSVEYWCYFDEVFRPNSMPSILEENNMLKEKIKTAHRIIYKANSELGMI